MFRLKIGPLESIQEVNYQLSWQVDRNPLMIGVSWFSANYALC